MDFKALFDKIKDKLPVPDKLKGMMGKSSSSSAAPAAAAASAAPAAPLAAAAIIATQSICAAADGRAKN